MGKLDGRVALITGGARGQGAAEARLLASEGAAIAISDVLDDDGEKTAAAVGGTYLRHDVTDESRWKEVIDSVVSRHGRLDILINNAGIYRPEGLLETSLAGYRQVIDVNQVGVFLGMKYAAQPMIARNAGAIVNISSVAGLRGGGGSFAYVASKFAVRGMTKSAAISLGRYGIRVNSIHPGLIETAMLHQVPAVEAGLTDRLLARVPIGRVAEPEEVAKLALFLASDDSSYCTGAEFVIDGGMTA